MSYAVLPGAACQASARFHVNHDDAMMEATRDLPEVQKHASGSMDLPVPGVAWMGSAASRKVGGRVLRHGAARLAFRSGPGSSAAGPFAPSRLAALRRFACHQPLGERRAASYTQANPFRLRFCRAAKNPDGDGQGAAVVSISADRAKRRSGRPETIDSLRCAWPTLNREQ